MTNARATRKVELLGELSDWWSAHPDGRAALTRVNESAKTGVYAYKLRIDGAWALDPENARTRAREGRRDNVWCVGGTPEPLLFAPVAPFVVEADRGGLWVTAALRRGAGTAQGTGLTVAWDEAGREARTRMDVVMEEDEHLVFRARIGASAARVPLRFVRDDGSVIAGEDGAPLVFTRSAASDGAPEWWRRARVYAIFVDRFRGASATDAAWGADPGADRAAGGSLDGITRSLDAIRDLGIDTLYLTPIHVGASCHRYDVIDPLRVDPALGGEEAFARLVAGCRARAMRLVIDFSFSHAGRGFEPYEDVLREGRASRFASFFQWTLLQETGEGSLACYGKRSDAPLFAWGDARLRALAMEAAEGWARRGVDGLRLDAAAEVPLDFARELRARFRALRPEGMVIGEVVPAHAWRWTGGDARAVDAATDFGFHAVIQELFARRSIDVPEALRRLDAVEIARGGAQSTALRFTSTHDHARLTTLARAAGNEAHATLALVMLCTWPGVPALLYGEEIGLAADVASLEPEAVWPDRMPMRWIDADGDRARRALVRSLLQARATSDALAIGEIEVLHAEGDLLVYRRSAGDDVVDVAIHLGEASVSIALEDEERPAMEPLARAGTADASSGCVILGPRSGIVVRRARSARETRSARVHAVRSNARVRDEEMASGAQLVRSWPSRIDFAITERCNLRCAHCITSAPELTKSGGARTLSPWLLDRLREALSYVEYVGFVHGGESLAAPIFWDALRAVAASRGAHETMVHLLTNGVLLGERTTHALIDHGVRSIAVSLDGARAVTNDAVRIGGRFEAIVANLRIASAVRRGRAADLRMGISLVVMRTNVAELDAFVDLAASCGVDWIKLEELAPITPAARALRVEDAEMKSAVQRAVARAHTRGLVVVDHVAPPPIWRCRLDPSAAAFLAADEHANRSTIHPCRAPWEHACIEPNGDVRLADFYGAKLGNIASASFGDIWSGVEARAARERAPSARLCGAGPVTCVSSPLLRLRREARADHAP